MRTLLFTALMACGTQAPSPTEEAPAEEAVAATAPAEDAHDHAGHDHAGHDHGAPKLDPGPIPEGARVFFKAPADGSTVTSPVHIEMGVEGMTVQPAGAIVAGTGHHHIIIDAEPVAGGTAVPADDKHHHFGKGQIETKLESAPGAHTLQLQFANGAHVSYGQPLSATIQVTVQ